MGRSTRTSARPSARPSARHSPSTKSKSEGYASWSDLSGSETRFSTSAITRDDIIERLKNIDEHIQTLSHTLESRRTYGHEDIADDGKLHRSRKCAVICNNDDCLSKCILMVVPYADLDSYRESYPYDVQHLMTDHGLRAHFERHQLVPDSIDMDDEEEAEVIADIYSMPIATVAISEQSWDKAMNSMKNPKHRAQLKRLVKAWKRRKNDFPAKAMDELQRKLVRHDSDNVIVNAITDN